MVPIITSSFSILPGTNLLISTPNGVTSMFLFFCGNFMITDDVRNYFFLICQ
nr:hypothetical protein [Clostridium butyricum]